MYLEDGGINTCLLHPGLKEIVNLQVMEPLEHWQATFRADGPSSESSASRTSSGCSSMMMQWQASRSERTLVGSSTTAVRKSRAHVCLYVKDGSGADLENFIYLG